MKKVSVTVPTESNHILPLLQVISAHPANSLFDEDIIDALAAVVVPDAI